MNFFHLLIFAILIWAVIDEIRLHGKMKPIPSQRYNAYRMILGALIWGVLIFLSAIV